MSVHNTAMTAAARRGPRPLLLDVAAEVLVADPAASLAEVAAAAGIGRTTLHKHYATRDDLLYAVGHRAIDLCEQAIGTVDEADPDGGLRALIAALIPIGPQLAFLWRTPAFDHMKDLEERWIAVEERGGLAVLRRAQKLGYVAADLPDWWLVQMLHSVVYVAAESVRAGRLAPLDAPGLAFRTLLRGTGEPQPSLKETS